ncbi:MAG TPA: GNAT family N-acetyltransferase [Pyrinomonadaceae bacterium]|jgi:ribosomal protein S18 acetylase RimI-like enzyme
MQRQVTTYYLEMTDPRELRQARAAALEVRRAGVVAPELNRFLYTAVGGDWYWTDRLPWSYQQWLDYLARPEVETWVGYVDGTPAGYFELETQPGGDVELAYFGLLPQFTGRGFGGLLLTRAVERAWALGARRVWLHTCTLDAPVALAAYQARGFRVYREETETKELPERAPGPWPGAR